jgi:murein DD-endopeptidase MepM/ murein hydrolase activator NlpD
MFRRVGLAFLLGAVCLPGGAAQASGFRLPLADYPIDDGCLAWGGVNSNFPRCDGPGRHVADDACAPNGTPVLAVADGVLRLAVEVEDCFSNWGWVVVVEHVMPDASRVCSIYGHCAPVHGIQIGAGVSIGQQIATIDNPCLPHIHFGIYAGAFAAADGAYPWWLLGYLPEGVACEQYPTPWPGNWVDPVQFVLDHVAVEPHTWGLVKTLYHGAIR